MSYINQAAEILSQAQLSVRSLIEQALSAKAYKDVSALANMADALSRISGVEGEANSVTEGTAPPEPSTLASADVRAVASRKSKRGPEFPRFEREADKLVKIGWSKRDARIYEHRAPHDVVISLTTALATIRKGALFTMDQVLPLNDNNGDEVPSYQAYLVLAWLRSIGIVDRRGKEGYVVQGSLEATNLQQVWEATPNRQ